MGLFVRKVRTASGAMAAQIAHKYRGVRAIVEHIGSAHDDALLAALVQIAKDKVQSARKTSTSTPCPRRLRSRKVPTVAV